MQNLPACEDLYPLLDTRIEQPERAAEIDADIKSRFEQTKAIFVLDMSGFSRLVQRYGIIHYLGMIQRMRRTVGPAVQRNNGAVVKFEADNCFAVFDSVDDAVKASLEIHRDLETANVTTADESDVHVSIGIGFGPILLFCDDMYGNELNLASKLGEDVAERDEILLTDDARKNLASTEYTFKNIPLTISGVDMNANKLLS